MAKRRSSSPSAREVAGGSTLAVHFDRIEEDGAGVMQAVLILDDGRSVVIPRDLLPADAAPDSVLRWTLALDPEATDSQARSTAAVRAQIKKTDPGGTIHL